jgi:hypothetical protein
MLTKSPTELFRSRDRLAGARSRETRQDVRVRSVVVPHVHRGGDTDALDWRSDPHLLAILVRGVKREREAREKDQFPCAVTSLTSQLAGLAPAHTTLREAS